MNKIIKRLIILIFVIALFSNFGHVLASDFVATQRTFGDYSSNNPQLQIVDSKIYYVFNSSDGDNTQIWTAEMNTDGSGWNATQRTFTAYNSSLPKLQVVDNKIYYVYSEHDGSNWQIWTAELNLINNNWDATKRTTSGFDKVGAEFDISGTDIYYVWQEHDTSGKRQIWTAKLDLNTDVFTTDKKTDTAYDNHTPQIQSYNEKIYYVWRDQRSGGNSHIFTAVMNTDGSEWTATQKTITDYSRANPQLQVVSDKIYYTWWQYDYNTWEDQIWTAEMNIDGSDWQESKRYSSDSGANFLTPQMQVYGSKIYYSLADNWKEEIWTAELNLNNDEWEMQKRRETNYLLSVYLQVSNSGIYYVWAEEDDDDIYQIWTAVYSSFDPSVSDTVNVSGIVDPSISFSLSSNIFTLSNMNASSVSKSNTIVLQVSTNAANGYSIVIKDEGDGADPGLYSSILTHLIGSTTTTLVAGTEGYGLSASSDTETISATYDKTSPAVGALSRNFQTLVSNNEPVDAVTTDIDVSTAISGTTPSGTYQDLIILVCTGNF